MQKCDQPSLFFFSLPLAQVLLQFFGPQSRIDNIIEGSLSILCTHLTVLMYYLGREPRDRLVIRILKLISFKLSNRPHGFADTIWKLMLVSMVNTGRHVNITRNRETRFEAGFTVSDFSFKVIKSRWIAWFQRERCRIQYSSR